MKLQIDTLHAILRTQTNSGPEKAMGCHYHQKLAKLDSFSLIEKDKMLHKYTKHDKIFTTV